MNQHRTMANLLIATLVALSASFSAASLWADGGDHLTPADRTPRLRPEASTWLDKDQLAHLLCMRVPRFTDKDMQKKCLDHVQAQGYYAQHGLYRIASDICVNFNSPENNELARSTRGTACFQTALLTIGGKKKNYGDFMKVYDTYCIHFHDFVKEYSCYIAAFAAVSKPDPDDYFKRHAPSN